MTRPVVTLTLLAALGSAACEQDYLCTTDDPPALLISAVSAANGVRLTSLSGTVTSQGDVLPLGCHTSASGYECNSWPRGDFADIHLESAGYAAWDTTGVRIEYSEGCRKPILKRIEAEMTPTSD
jgi:hypothetical protein